MSNGITGGIDSLNTVISTNTIIRWIIGASAAIIMMGGSFWLNRVSKQIDRIEENLSSRIIKMEAAIDSIRTSELGSGEKYTNRMVDLQIKLEINTLKIEQLERILGDQAFRRAPLRNNGGGK